MTRIATRLAANTAQAGGSSSAVIAGGGWAVMSGGDGESGCVMGMSQQESGMGAALVGTVPA